MEILCKYSIELKDTTTRKYLCKLKKDNDSFIDEFCNFTDSKIPNQEEVESKCSLYREANMNEEIKKRTRNEINKIIETKKDNLPKIWIGYLIAICFLFVEIYSVITAQNLNEDSTFTIILTLIGLSGGIYWLKCIYKIHKYLYTVSLGEYSISPNKAVGFLFIPFYSLYWVFKWSNEISNFLINRNSSKLLKKGWSGFFILIGLLIGRFIDGAIGMFIVFSAILNINNKIKTIKLD